jgi:tRNA(Phe) wybutosine-synthesizing methylase Tyw3
MAMLIVQGHILHIKNGTIEEARERSRIGINK